MRFLSVCFLLVSVAGQLSAADPPQRWIPDHCHEIAEDSPRTPPTPEPLEPEPRWNRSYQRGFRAIERGDYHLADREMCAALLAARLFGARDWRFAETLDELGLIAFELGDFDRAERVQGAAIAEMLLAVGPHGEPFRDREPSDQAPIRPDCRSGLRVYIERLGWIHERVPGRVAVSELKRAPWRIFAAGYLPLDARLAKRLDWLVSRYLLEENLVAVEELNAVATGALEDEP